MNLQQKHLAALQDKDYCKKESQKIIEKIDNDKTGSCWNKQETFDYMERQAIELDNLSVEEKAAKPFYGLSVGMKDLFCINGLKTTAGSRILENFIAPYDSHMWQVLKNKGALLGAKLAMDEFAMGSFSNTSSFGKVSIPNFSENTAGGSSGGSGSALAAGLVDFTTGSDTGGSVRLPASFCSVVGYKPSYGTFSRYGMIAYASSLDQAGLLTNSLEDMKYLLSSQIAERDSRDMTSKGMKYSNDKKFENKKIIGFFEEFLTEEGVDEDVKKAYALTLDKLKSAGYALKSVSIPYMKEAAQIYYIIACSEASSNLARYQGVFFGEKLLDKKRDGSYWEQVASYRNEFLGLEVKKRIMLGSYILSSENFDSMYKKAVCLRQSLKNNFANIFKDVSGLVLPVSPTVSPTWDKISHMTTAQIYMSDYMTVPFSLAGLPALSLPWYKDKQGLGIGMQFVGAQYEDANLIEMCLDIEKKLNQKIDVV